jgi:cell division cycle protein 20 (cofactor of APC complex)
MASFNKPTSAADLAEFEALAGLTTSSLKPSGTSRWERKKAALKNSTSSNTPSKRSRSALESNTPSKQSSQADRFIPHRPSMDLDQAGIVLGSENAVDREQSEYQKMLENELCDGREHRVLSFKNKAPVADASAQRREVLYSANHVAADKPRSSAKSLRHIPSAPTRVLDAPDLLDDYYLNLVSWSSENIIAVALGPAVYLWNAKTGGIEELMALECESDYVCSLEWIPGGSHLAVGTASAQTQLWDATALKQVRNMDGHTDRISSLAWNQHLLSSGSKDTTIVHHDVRVQEHKAGILKGHTQEVCGLKWSHEGHALASGGNDNLLCIWDAAVSGQRANAVQQPKFTCGEHCAAVKALAWSPHERNLVASGGGTADRCIKFWNTQTGSMLNSIDTGSQVCSLLWNPHEKEILSSHGFSKNELCLWKYPSMCKVKELTGHTARVLHMANSPNGSQVVSAGADETLRFWDVFGDAPEVKKAKSGLASGGAFNSSMQIR